MAGHSRLSDEAAVVLEMIAAGSSYEQEAWPDGEIAYSKKSEIESFWYCVQGGI
jgi:hypothetical protein